VKVKGTTSARTSGDLDLVFFFVLFLVCNAGLQDSPNDRDLQTLLLFSRWGRKGHRVTQDNFSRGGFRSGRG